MGDTSADGEELGSGVVALHRASEYRVGISAQCLVQSAIALMLGERVGYPADKLGCGIELLLVVFS